MRHIRTLTALGTASLSLAAAAGAHANPAPIGSANIAATMNVCAASIVCTYVNYDNNKPTDVVKRAGTIIDFTVLRVRRGDVLALGNATSGLYMAVAPAGTCVHYFQSPLSNGSSGKPNQVVPQLHLLLSADTMS